MEPKTIYTEVVKVSPEAHQIVKVEAAKAGISMQEWLDALIKNNYLPE